MQIAVMSDTHSRYPSVEAALAKLRERKVSHVIHCGDITDADTVWLFQGLTCHFVFGNCDVERASLRQAIDGIGETLHEPFGHLEVEGVKIGFVHGDDTGLLRDLENSGAFDFVFHGHTHRAAEHCVEKTRVINPGAFTRVRTRTFIVLDLPSGSLESVEVE